MAAIKRGMLDAKYTKSVAGLGHHFKHLYYAYDL